MTDVEALIGRFAARLGAAEIAYGHGTDNARDEAYRLVLGGLRGRALTPASRAELEALLEQRIGARVPVPYLTGEAWLGGARFDVPTGVMIPRSPIAAVLAAGVAPWLAVEPARILDLCCGTGALGVLAARAFPRARVDLVDDDARAIGAAAINVEQAGVGDRAELVKSSLFEGLAGRRYDLIVCNPPYVPTTELDSAPAEFGHEPRHGLDGGADGLAVWRRIVACLDDFVEPGGVLLGETGNVSAAFDAAFPHLRAVWLAVDGAERQAGGDFGVFVAGALEPSAGEREGPAPRKKEPSAGEREGPAPRKQEPSAGEREGLTPRM